MKLHNILVDASMFYMCSDFNQDLAGYRDKLLKDLGS